MREHSVVFQLITNQKYMSMKKRINRILNILRHTYGINALSTSEDICHTIVTAKMTRIISLPSLRLYLRTLSKAAGLECEIDCGGGIYN